MIKHQKILLIAGARPNFMKIAPIYRASLDHPEVEYRVVREHRKDKEGKVPVGL